MNEQEPKLPEACAAAREDLGAFLDAELDTATHAAVERHLAECPACRAEWVLLHTVSASVGAMPRPAPPEALRYRLRAVVEADAAPRHFEFRTTKRRVRGWVHNEVTTFSPRSADVSDTPVGRQTVVRLIEREYQERIGACTFFCRVTQCEERSANQ